MTPKKIRAYLQDDKNDISDRLFLLLACVALLGLASTVVGSLIIGEDIIAVIFLVVSFFVFFLILLIGLKTNHMRAAANVVSFVLIFGLLPMTFFTSGGVYGGTPLWFLFDALFIGLILNGKSRVFFYVCFVIVTIVCWYVEYTHPESVIAHTEDAVYSDSFASLMLVTVIMTVLINYQNRTFREETVNSEKQRKKIEELNASQNRFFSSMSHEIRTPINTIIGLHEMILREAVSEEVCEDAEKIQAASKMLLQLINDILDMSKFESGQMTISPSPYDTADMVTELLGMFWIRAREKNLEFHVNVSPEIPETLVGDEVRIKQMLINLINNAIKYTKEGSVTFSVECEHKGDDEYNIIYSVTDTGIGIKRENIPYLFNAFKRVDEDKNKYIEGTGLGLSIVKQFADLMGGKITVNSVYTKGTTFVVELPQKRYGVKKIGNFEAEKRHELSVRTEYHQSFEAPQAQVLVVDDTPANLLVVSKLLRETKVNITTVESGAAALEKTLKQEFHLILMDHMMPEMDGIQCMHRIRDQIGGLSRQAKIVALTANADRDNQQLYRRERFDGYLVKPISGEILERELVRLLPKELVTLKSFESDIMQESVAWIDAYHKKDAISISTETVADLPQELIELYNLSISPITVMTKEGTFRDLKDVNSSGMLSYMKNGGTNVDIREVAVGVLENSFAEQLKHANNVIHISTSSRVPHSSYENAMEAARAFDNVTVVDSGTLSGGQGLLVLEASRLAKEGCSPEEVVRRLEKMKQRLKCSFTVENLDYLAAMGQVSPRVARVLDAFMIRPVVRLRKGVLKVGQVFVGSREHALSRYIKTEFFRNKQIDKRLLFVNYAGVSEKELEWIRQRIEKKIKFDRIIFQECSAAISVNSGPGTIGFFYQTLEKS